MKALRFSLIFKYFGRIKIYFSRFYLRDKMYICTT
jgi:hypothetical protein